MTMLPELLYLARGCKPPASDYLDLGGKQGDFFSRAYTYARSQGFPTVYGSQGHGVLFKSRKVTKARTAAEPPELMDIEIPLFIAGEGDDTASNATGDVAVANEKAIFTKWREAVRSYGFADGEAVYLWMRLTGSKTDYWHVRDLAYDVLHIDTGNGITEPLRAGVLTLTCDRYPHSDPVADPTSRLLAPTQALYRAAIPGDVGANTRLLLIPQAGGVPQRWTLSAHSRDRLLVDGFTSAFAPTAGADAAVLADSGALNGASAQIVALSAAWKSLAEVRGTGRGHFRLVWRVKDGAQLVGGIELDPDAGAVDEPGHGTIITGTLDAVLAAVDASGHIGPLTRRTVQTQGGDPTVSTLFNDDLSDGGAKWSFLNAIGSPQATVDAYPAGPGIGFDINGGASAVEIQTPNEPSSHRLYVRMRLYFASPAGHQLGKALTLGGLVIAAPNLGNLDTVFYIGADEKVQHSGFVAGDNLLEVLWDGNGGLGQYKVWFRGLVVANVVDSSNQYPQLLRIGDIPFASTYGLNATEIFMADDYSTGPLGLGSAVLFGPWLAPENAAHYRLWFQFTPLNGEPSPWQRVQFDTLSYELTSLSPVGAVQENPPEEGAAIEASEVRLACIAGDGDPVPLPPVWSCDVSAGQYAYRSSGDLMLPPAETPFDGVHPWWRVLLQARNLGATTPAIACDLMRLIDLDDTSCSIEAPTPLSSAAAVEVESYPDDSMGASFIAVGAMDLTGGEILDAQRDLGIDGDGVDEPGGAALYQAVTNECAGPRPYLNLASWPANHVSVNLVPALDSPWPSGPALQIITLGTFANEGVDGPHQFVTSGVTKTYSIQAKALLGQHFTLTAGSVEAGNLAQVNCVGTGAWKRYAVTFTAPASVNAFLSVGAGAPGATASMAWEIDGAQYETGIFPTPFALGSRVTAGVRHTAYKITPTSGTVAAELIMGLPGQGAVGTQTVWSWTPTSGFAAYMQVAYNPTTGLFFLQSVVGATSEAAFSTTPMFFLGGETIQVLGAWDATHLTIAVNGATVTVTRTVIPTGLDTKVDIGTFRATAPLNGTVSWLEELDHRTTDTEIAIFAAIDGTGAPIPSTVDNWSIIWDTRSAVFLKNSPLGAAQVTGALRMGQNSILSIYTEQLNAFGQYIAEAPAFRCTVKPEFRPRHFALAGADV